MRTSPNVVITGTPGVGKTVHCEQLAQETGLKHLSINQVVKERECHEGFDRELKSYIVDEDKVRTANCPTPRGRGWVRRGRGSSKSFHKSRQANQRRTDIVTRCDRGGYAEGRESGRLARL